MLKLYDMKILIGNQIKDADRYTIENEPISSIDLMERASLRISDWINNNLSKENPLLFLIGKGNNGGDGLAIARILSGYGFYCHIFLAFPEQDLSPNSKINLERLPKGISIINKVDSYSINKNVVIIDALLGTGVKGLIKEPLVNIISKINDLPNQVISIDIPSGMKNEFENKGQCIIKADITLTIEYPKLAMMLPEAGSYCGDIHIIPINLHKDFIDKADSQFYYTTEEDIKGIKLKRDKFAHKNTYGHALLICGSEGMIGAAILSTGAALRSGCGLVTLHIPKEERFSVQSVHPSALLDLDKSSFFSIFPPDLSKYNSIGIGSGMGQSEETVKAFSKLLNKYHKPMVFDADALNILAKHPDLQKQIPSNSVLTPHLGELKRLIGDWQDEQHKIELVKEFAGKIHSTIVVKGANTMICSSNGKFYFNSTGNSGMAKGGSGDILTGYIAGLMSRDYNGLEAAVLGVYTHGLAGDRAALKYGEEAMNSSDILEFLF